ncbi:hypothetical protein [Streptomyces sp. NPDC048516]|uniref:hypothetical protein n=1 Tax=Streptomyces sp. NPDC048516 TaxID=3365565 RepID=UPI00371A55FF
MAAVEMTAQELAEFEQRVRRSERLLSGGTWVIAAGMVIYSMLTATPFVAAHTPDGWELTAPVLPIVVDSAFIISLRLDAALSAMGAGGGLAPWLLRVATGAASTFLNVWGSVEKADWTGVGVHIVPPLLLVLTAEAGPAYRRRLVQKLDSARRVRRAVEARETQQRRADDERRRAERQQEEERREARRAAEQEREDRREESRRAHELKLAQITAPPAPPARTSPTPEAPQAPHPPAPEAAQQLHQAQQAALLARVQNGRSAIPHPAPEAAPAEVIPEPAVSAPAAPAPRPVSVHAAVSAPVSRVTARVEDQPEPEAQPDPEPEAVPLTKEELDRLTDEQVVARLRYGWQQGWTTRQAGDHAGRSHVTANNYFKKFKAEQDDKEAVAAAR